MKYKINLLPRRDKKLLDKLIYFALNYLRYILVITQIVIIGVFFYRFQIDQQLIDIKDELEQKKEIITVSSPLVKQANAVDNKLKEINQILAHQNKTNQILDYIITVFPENFYLNSFESTENSIKISGISQDIETVRAFINRLKKEKRFKTVELSSIKKIDFGFAFSFQLENFSESN